MVHCRLVLEEIEEPIEWLGEKLQALLMDDGYFVSIKVLCSKFVWTSIARNLTIDHNCNLITQKLSFLDVVCNHDHGRTLNVLDNVQ